ncbi:MAG TPA: POTRA domain-containing protein [Edaphobacter sp.]|nr:POTRA domain-containing protein [Edaphobacter sp.]
MRSSSVRLALLALCLSVPSIRLSAQTFKLPAITFAGAPAFSQADLLKVSGLHPGATSTQAEVQAAAQHLSDTGLFADVHFESNAKGLVYTLKPMPSDNLLPAAFANFVWWTPEELAAALKSRVPLYIGVVPISGNLQDSITAALKAMVAEKGVTANVVAIPAGQAGATPTAIAFEIESPEVRVHTLTLAQTSPAMQSKLDRVIKDQTGKPFGQDATRSAITTLVKDVYLNEGYLDIAVLDLTHNAPQISASGIDLDLTATIQEGAPYRLTQLTWQGSDIMSAADFNKQLKLKPEDVASQQALRQSLAPLAHAYYAKGFQDAKIQASATTDRATHHVAYTVRVVPGDQYRLHSVKAVGLSDEQRKQFDSAWHMNAGDFYDINYMAEFLKKNSALQTLRGYSATWKALSDPNTHLVDLTITFVKGGTLINVN